MRRCSSLLAGDFGFAELDGLSQTGQEVEFAVDIEADGLILGKVFKDVAEASAHAIPAGQSFVEAKVSEAIANDFQPQENAPLFVLLEEGMFPVGAEDVHALVEPFHDVLEFAVDPAVGASPEQLADTIGANEIKHWCH